MKNKLRYIIIGIVSLIIIAIVSIVIINIVSDENKLTVDEKKWINTNLSTLQNANVINNSPVYGNNGYGVFFDFLNDFSKEYQIKVNPITYNIGENNVDSGFKLTNNIDNNSVVFESDYYVLIGKNYEHIIDIDGIGNKNVGVVSNSYSYLSNYLNINLVSYSNYSELEKAFEENDNIKYMLVPRTLYMDYIVKNSYSIIYHFGGIKAYYVLQMKNDDTFSIILKKFYNNWKKDNLSKTINNNLLNCLTNSLSLSEKDLSTIKAKVYNYGFVNNNPYEVLIGGNYGGIVSEYLEKFSNFTGVEFKFTKYKNYSQFVNAVSNKEVDLYFNYYSTNNEFRDIDTQMNVTYVIAAKNTNGLVVNSISTLQNLEISVLENSILSSYLSNVSNVKINTYKSISDLKKLGKKNAIIMLDKETFDYLKTNDLKDYTIRYTNTTDSTYNFKLNTDDSFYRLFNAFVTTQDPEFIRISGLYNHEKTIKKGSIFGTIAVYILVIIVALSLVLYILYRSSKKIKISKKIKKEDKIKFIDQLTSLKNRNYLNENIDGWNKNRIYPQATIVIDLNKIQEINDTKGYDEGDRQIKAASNILIRTQLDNSDIMRTDGNEFLIYTVGYDKRTIESYIRKLIKEFKNLPYDYSAIISYSLIENDLKTIEDAINEAVDDMKIKKQEI
ncbi:MAG: diguanylate cyclase [Bacilli bacterium]|nr:diguanylate cyclase [Bacilli bacterium]